MSSAITLTSPVCNQGVDWNKLYLEILSEQHVYQFQMLVHLLHEPVLRDMISRLLWLMEYCVEFPSESCVIRFVRCGCM